jgi:hypothetical protein
VTDNLGIGAMGMNPLSGVLDSMEMIKRAWSSFQLPAGIAPTMDIEELDRRIKDMKAVEQWLKLNLQMLQGSIQAMELQRNTIATFQAFGQTMTPPSAPPAQAAKGRREAPEADGTPAQGQPAAEAAGAMGATAQEFGNAAAAAMNPTAWWNLLTTQFEQVAQAALQGAQTPPATEATPARKRSTSGRSGHRAATSASAGSRPRKTPSGG